MTRERLKNYKALTEEKRQLQRQIEKIEAVILSPRAQKIDGMPKQASSGSGSDLLIKHIELQKAYHSKIEEIAIEQIEIEKAIEKLEPRLRTLIRLHYFEGMTWNNICKETSYSWTSVHRMHREAMKRLKESEGIDETQKEKKDNI